MLSFPPSSWPKIKAKVFFFYLGEEGRCHLTDVPMRILSLFFQKASFECSLGMTLSSLSFRQGRLVLFCCSGRSHLGLHRASRMDHNLGHLVIQKGTWDCSEDYPSVSAPMGPPPDVPEEVFIPFPVATHLPSSPDQTDNGWQPEEEQVLSLGAECFTAAI